MNIRAFCLLLIAVPAFTFSQVTSSRLDGTVTDQQGASVVNADVKVVQAATGQTFDARTDERGYWALPSMASGVYRITVTVAGFKTALVDNVKMDANVPATVNIKLEVGGVAETVEVASGADVLQAETATVSSTLQGRQIHDLPFTSHNATELIATQPGTQTALGVRYSQINGLPQSSINITMDGINIQDNTNKSTDGIFNNIQPRIDAMEEMTITTAAAGADSTGEGAVQIKFVTRAGTNVFHGGAFWQNRNTIAEANYYFNSVNGQPRDLINLNQFGGQVGGPILKNKLFFFAFQEAFRLPQSFLTSNEVWLTPSAQNGIFTYKDSSGNVDTVNLYQLAAAGNQKLAPGTRAFSTAPDPTLAKTYALINQLTTTGKGQLSSRIPTANDYNRSLFAFPNQALNNRNFSKVRLDYNITDKHHLNFVYDYQTNNRSPDGLNGTLAILPGTGTVLGNGALEGQTGNNFSGSLGLRSSLTTHLTNEFIAGLQAGTNTLGSGLAPSIYGLWNGYQPNFGLTTTAATSSAATALYMSNPYLGSYTGFAPRNAPVKQINDNLSLQKGRHLLNFGGSFSQINIWQAAANSSIVPTIFFGQQAGDPDNTGTTSLFTTTTLPGASPTQLSDAANLYAILTGRVASITSSSVLNEKTKIYGSNYAVDRNRIREFALYLQDTWRVNSALTVSAGLRWDKQNPFENSNGLYTSVGLAGLYGVSGIGHLFQPGVLTGQAPVFTPFNPGQDTYQSRIGNFNPSVGLAYRLPKSTGFARWLTGEGESVFRAGFSIATIREGMGFLQGVVNGNQGRSLSTSVDPINFPANFGAPGSVNFSDPTLPTRAPVSIDPNYPNPSFPLAVQSGQTVSDFNPNIKPEYVSSWNVGFQRELDRNTVVEVRYVGNHGTNLWRSINLNEVNIFENNFLTQFNAAANNLAISRLTTPTSNNFGTGLPGQVAVPIITTALGTSTDQTTATQLSQGQAGALANAIATNATRIGNLTKAGFPVNLFQVNPLNGGNSNMMTNGSSSTYNSAQVEVRRRLAAGLQVQGSYAFSKSLTNVTNFTLRDIGGEKGPTGFDIRNGFKLTWIYQLPFGPGRSFLSSSHGVLSRAIGGWQLTGVGRLQSGTPVVFGSGRMTVNQNDSGVVLHNITASQLQNMMGIYKTSNVSANGAVTGTVWYLPQPIVKNSLAAFQLGGTLDPNAPYIGPPTTGGQEGNRIFLYGPWISKWDMSIVKSTQIRERMNLEVRIQALNVFNFANFELPNGTGGNTVLGIGSTFGQTTNAFRDLNNTNDPGSRTLELAIRFNF